MARIIDPVKKPPTVTVEFTRDEALVVRAIFGRVPLPYAIKILDKNPYIKYPRARELLRGPESPIRAIYDTLEDYFGDER